MNRIKYSILGLLCLLVLQLKVAFGQDDGCAQNITFEQNHTFSSEISAESTIESSNSTINPNVNVVFKAGDEITLKDGFVALENSNFRAFNGEASCNNVSFSNGTGVCETVDFDIVPETTSLKFEPLSKFRPTSNDDPPTQYVIEKIGDLDFVPVVRNIMWESVVYVNVPNSNNTEYVVYVNKNNCAPPGSGGTDNPPGVSDDCISNILSDFTLENNSTDDTYKPLFVFDVESGESYTYSFDADIIGQKNDFVRIGLSYKDANGQPKNENHLNIEVNKQFGYTETIEIPQNVTQATLFAWKPDTRDKLVVTNLCLDAGGGNDPPGISETCTESIAESFTFSPGNGSWTKVREEIVQLNVGSTYKIKFSARLSNGGNANIGISTNGSTDIGFFDKRKTIENSADFAIHEVGPFVGEVNHTNATAYALKSDANSNLEIRDFCLILVGGGSDPNPNPGDGVGCEPANANSNTCNPHDWLVNFETGQDNFAQFSPNPPKSGTFKVGMNLSRIEPYGTMIAHKNIFKLMEKWSTVPFINSQEIAVETADVVSGCSDNFILLDDIFKNANKPPFNNLKVQTATNGSNWVDKGITFDAKGYPDCGLPIHVRVVEKGPGSKVIVPATKVGIGTKGLTFSGQDAQGNWSKRFAGLSTEGDYRIFYQGQGSLLVNKVPIQNSGATFSLNENGSIFVTIKSSGVGTSNLKNIRIYKVTDVPDSNGMVNLPSVANDIDGNGNLKPGKLIYYDEYLERLSDFPLIRVMNMNRTNHSTLVNFGDIPADDYYTYATSVVDRYAADCGGGFNCISQLNQNLTNNITSPCWQTFPVTNDRGAPLEEVKNMYNAVKSFNAAKGITKKIDIWYNIPHNATDSYVTGVGQKFNEWFKSENINVYLEYSNEIWNDNFKQKEDVRKFNESNCRVNDNNCNEHGHYTYFNQTSPVCIDQALIEYAQRSKDIFQLFESRLQSASNAVKLKRVIAGQHGNPTVTAKIVRFLQPDDFEVLSVGGYFYPKIDGSATSLQSRDAIFIDPDGDGNGRWDFPATNHTTPDQIKTATINSINNLWKPQMMKTKRIADCYGVELILYEGGQHITNGLLTDFENKKSYKIVPSKLNEFQNSQQMKEIYESWFNILKNDVKIDGILAYSLAAPPKAETGSWGHIKNTFENPCNSKKYMALMNPAFGNSSPCGGQRNSSEISLSTSFQVYPNPFSNNLTLKTEMETGQMRIVDMTGRILLQQAIESKTTTINTETLKPGYYLVEVENGGRTQTQKIIKH